MIGANDSLNLIVGGKKLQKALLTMAWQKGQIGVEFQLAIANCGEANVEKGPYHEYLERERWIKGELIKAELICRISDWIAKPNERTNIHSSVPKSTKSDDFSKIGKLS